MRSLALVATITVWGFALACSDPAGEVGDHCQQTSECADGKCQTGGGFPGGICTRQCESNAECPSGWSCISKSSGICVMNCSKSDECASRFGASWLCDDEALQQGSGDVTVCIGK